MVLYSLHNISPVIFTKHFLLWTQILYMILAIAFYIQ
ncbi:MAG TPA: hypothetical protein IAB62_13585 [Candidatus Coprocola pullicola]|nr:hypothetical protein [Candidatus Coprocola pullicola]